MVNISDLQSDITGSILGRSQDDHAARPCGVDRWTQMSIQIRDETSGGRHRSVLKVVAYCKALHKFAIVFKICEFLQCPARESSAQYNSSGGREPPA